MALPFLGAILGPIGTASALVTLVPYGNSGLNYDSNLFKVSSGSALPAQPGGKAIRDDYYLLSTLGLDAGFESGEQRVRFNAEGRRVDYKRATDLDHNEYRIGGGLDLSLPQGLGSSVDYGLSRHISTYENLGITTRAIVTDRNAGAQFHFQPGGRWTAEAGTQYSDSKTPILTDPSFKLVGISSNAGLSYLVGERLGLGVHGNYNFGHFAGDTTARSGFDSWSIDGTGNYEVTGLTKLALSVGSTTRHDQVPTSGASSVSSNTSGSSSAFTGSLAYSRELTGKTSLQVSVDRDILSYTVGRSAIVQSGGHFTLNWNGSDKIDVGASFNQSYLKLLTKDPNDQQNFGRKDRLQVSRVDVRYNPVRWLYVNAYGGYQNQKSNRDFGSYNSAIAGLELGLRFE